MAIAVTLVACAPVQLTTTASSENRHVVTVRGDGGGEMLKYALRVKKLEKQQSLVRFGGGCESACTLYLAMPNSQICLLRGAFFRFHMPHGSTANDNRIAAQYMMRNYPDWVQTWIHDNGGLTRNMKTMRYDYAAQFIKPCEQRI